MVNGVVVGTVKDNVDPEGIHRVLVEYPVAGEQAPASTWCRMSSPMAGAARGMVMLPDKGTEVVLAFGTKSLHPYVIGAVYNGKDDQAKTYANEDGQDHIRLFWSRAGSMVMFNDEPGKESVSMGVTTPSQRDVTGGAIHQTLDAANKVYTEYSDKDTIWEVKETLSIKCKNFKLVCENDLSQDAGMTLVHNAKLQASQKSTLSTYKAAQVHINGGKPLTPKKCKPTPAHKHPPTVGGAGGASAASVSGASASAVVFDEPVSAVPVSSEQPVPTEERAQEQAVLMLGERVQGLSHAPDGSLLESVVVALEEEPEAWTVDLPKSGGPARGGGSWAPHPHCDHVGGVPSQSAQDSSGAWSRDLTPQPLRRPPRAAARPAPESQPSDTQS